MHQGETDKTNRAKKAAGRAAAEWIQPGMLVGIGTGTTVFYFIQALAERCRAGLEITAIATSRASEKLAREGGIPLADSDTVVSLDITVDGADEIDPVKRMIKGGGGALLREKMLASSSKEMVVIIDESKLVEKLGRFPLPIEAAPFMKNATKTKVTSLGYKGDWRKQADQTDYITDNGNRILDIHPNILWENPSEANRVLQNIPGVLETGFFLGLAGRILVGQTNGSVQILP